MRMVEPRTEVGKTQDGYSVFIFHFQGSPDSSGTDTEHRFEVRSGNHTITTKATREEAQAVADALVGDLNVREVPMPESVAEHASQVRAKVSKG